MLFIFQLYIFKKQGDGFAEFRSVRIDTVEEKYTWRWTENEEKEKN